MYKGIGLDLCEISRMEKMVENAHFLQRYFTEEEIRYIQSRGAHRAESLAGIYAAKEAFSKAMGTGICFDLREVEIRHGENGEPCYALHGETAEKTKGEGFLLSISHDGGIAGAVCLREKTEKQEKNR